MLTNINLLKADMGKIQTIRPLVINGEFFKIIWFYFKLFFFKFTYQCKYVKSLGIMFKKDEVKRNSFPKVISNFFLKKFSKKFNLTESNYLKNKC